VSSTPFAGGDLVCPLDALPLTRIPSGPPGLAVHTCGRHEYPEVCGIPVLTGTPAAERALELAHLGKAAEARAVLVTPDREGRADLLARALDRLLGARRFALARRERRLSAFRARHGDAPPKHYREALAALLLEPPAPQPESFHYFVNRPSDPTFVVAEAVTSAVPADVRTLDLCCGSGWVTRLLCRRSPAVTGLDEYFALLELARTHVAPAARFVCARADRPLPFPEGAFDAVVCSDALHDTSEPGLVAREMERVMDANATAFVVHLHNPRCAHAYPGRNPLEPEGYAAIFAGSDPRLLDEGPILERWLAAREVDLTAAADPESLRKARTLTLLAGNRAPDQRLRGAAPAAAGLALSPLYRATSAGNGALQLERRWPSEFWLVEYPDAARYLPERATLPAATVAALRAGRIDTVVDELARHRVLIDLPEAFGGERPWEAA
jgi:SAM-dependent methyltransferase